MLKIKIVHVIESLCFGGAQRFVVDLCNEVAKTEKYDVYILSLCDNDLHHSLLNDISPDVNYISFKKGAGIGLTALVRLTKWLKNECPHVVHSHLNAYEYLLLYRIFDSRTAFFHTIHKPAHIECTNIFFKKIRANSYRYNQVTPISISQSSSRGFREYYKLNNDIVIQSARPELAVTIAQLDLTAKYKDGSYLMVHVGNITNGKNQQLLVRAIQLYNLTALKKCRLIIIGEIKDQRLFYQLNELLQDDCFIEFIGAKHNIADYLSIADGFCLSSTMEGMPISLIEAMSMGCIPICTPVGAIKEIVVDGVTGFLSKAIEVDSYCKALKRALDSSDREGIKYNIQKIYKKKYQINISALNHINIYKKALNLFEGRDNAFELLYKSKT